MKQKSKAKLKWRFYRLSCKTYLEQEPSIEGFKTWLKQDDLKATNQTLLPALAPEISFYKDSQENASNTSIIDAFIQHKDAVNPEIQFNRPRGDELSEITSATIAELHGMDKQQIAHYMRQRFNRAANCYQIGAIELERYHVAKDILRTLNAKVELPNYPKYNERATVNRNAERIGREREIMLKKEQMLVEKENKQLGALEALFGILKTGKGSKIKR